MRVIFLDFGGVTHPARLDDAARDAGVRWDAFCWLDILQALIEPHADVYVVVHSNWRYACSAAEIGDLLGELGRRFLGCAPPGDRHGAIRAWLAAHPEVESYRIVDDSPKSFGDPPPAELILCDPRTGLSEPRVQAQIRDWLQRS